jgi:hypothetical protein
VSALELRLLMIVIGLLIIVVLYIWYRGSRNDDIVNIFEEEDDTFLDDIPDFDSFDEQRICEMNFRMSVKTCANRQ